MCRRSPSCRVPAALSAGATPEQLLESIDACAVTIAPVDSQAVGTHQPNRYRPNVARHTRGVQQGTPAHLLHAPGTGAGQAKRTGGEEAHVPVLVPFDEEAVVPAINGVGDHIVK